MAEECSSQEELDSCPVDLHSEFLRCKSSVYNEIHGFKNEMHNMAVRMDSLEAGHSKLTSTLQKHEEQRKIAQEKMEEGFLNMYKAFSDATKDNEDRHEVILNTLQTLKEDTDKNTSFIDKIRKYRTIIGISLSTATGMSYGLYKLLEWMQTNGMIILFPTGG